MSTVPTPPAELSESRSRVWVWIIGAVAAVFLAAFVWLGYRAFSHTSPVSPSSLPPVKTSYVDPPNPPPVTIAPPAGSIRPSGTPTYTPGEVDILKEQARQEERSRIAIEQQYGK
jgi:hypothetical protein